MLEIYAMPLDMVRFNAYLQFLQGGITGAMHRPVGGYNPMGKDHMRASLDSLVQLNAEEFIQDELQVLNQDSPISENWICALNVCDDLHGGWTNRYSTDFDIRFRYQGLYNRQMAMIILWSSEIPSYELLAQRTKEAIARIHYWMRHGMPTNLVESVRQEQQVHLKVFGEQVKLGQEQIAYLDQYSESEDYLQQFAFFYGDEGCKALGYPTAIGPGWINASSFFSQKKTA
jgi:hypothetical protein